MSRRFKSSRPPREFPRTLGPAGEKRVLAREEPWLRIWCEQLTVTHAELAKRSGLSLARIDALARDADMPTAEELEAIAHGLETTVEAIIAIQD